MFVTQRHSGTAVYSNATGQGSKPNFLTETVKKGRNEAKDGKSRLKSWKN